MKNESNPGTSGNSRLFSRSFKGLPILFLGIMAFLMIWWNGKQVETLLNWAREREGRQQWMNLQQEASSPLRELVDHPELLQELIEQSSIVVSAGILGHQSWLHCFSKQGFPSVASYPVPASESAVALENNLVIARFHFRGGPRGGPGGDSPGKGVGMGMGRRYGQIEGRFSEGHEPLNCGRENDLPETNAGNQRSFGGPFEVVLIFPDVDQALVFPLRMQQIFWLLIWLLVSGLWYFALKTHESNLVLHEARRQEAHLSAIGRMTARLAHEIKNPLGAIRGTAQHLQKKLREQAGVHDLLGMIESETVRLEELARGILDFSRPYEFNLVPVNVIPVVKECVALLSRKFPERTLAFSSDLETVIITADANALRQVLINVIHNAIEADDRRLPVEIRVNREAEWIRILVLDQGPGLNGEAMERIFEPFFSTKTKGYGLGLVICKKILESHHGSFRLENRMEGGCCAELLFPAGGQE